MDGLPLKIENLEDIPAEFHSLYVKAEDETYQIVATNIRTQQDVDRIKSALEKERNDHKAVKDKLNKTLSGKSPEELQLALDELEQLKSKTKNPDNSADIQAKIDAATAMLKREIEQDRLKLAEQQEEITKYKGRDRDRKIEDKLREAIGKDRGIVSTAVQDILFFAKFAFEVDQDGNVITKDTHGVQAGLLPSVWLSSMQDSRPHWWGATQGGGATGSKGGSSSNPWSEKNWNMTEQGKIFQENPEKARQLAASAGSKIGAIGPTKK